MDLNVDIHVNYSAVEELFASKTIQPKETENIKKPTEVRYMILLLKNIIIDEVACSYISNVFVIVLLLPLLFQRIRGIRLRIMRYI